VNSEGVSGALNRCLSLTSEGWLIFWGENEEEKGLGVEISRYPMVFNDGWAVNDDELICGVTVSPPSMG
jgi:hypothetical protein